LRPCGKIFREKRTNRACTDSSLLYKTKEKLERNHGRKKTKQVTNPVLWKANITRAEPRE
jgi:hypothetical protein